MGYEFLCHFYDRLSHFIFLIRLEINCKCTYLAACEMNVIT